MPMRRSRRWNSDLRFVGWAAAFLLAGLVSMGSGLQELSEANVLDSVIVSKRSSEFQASTLPQLVRDWAFAGFDSREANPVRVPQSRWVWRYRDGELTATFVVDFHFQKWNDLSRECVTAGWVRRGTEEVVCPASSDLQYMASRFERNGRHGYLIYSFLQDDARPVHPPGRARSIAQAIQRRLQNNAHALYGIRLWVTSDRELLSPDHDEARRLYEELHNELLRALTADLPTRESQERDHALGLG
jgi:hypothetical protein